MQKRLRKNAFTYLNGFFGNTQKAILCLSNNGCLLYDSYVGPFLNIIPFDIGISGKGRFLSKSLMWLKKICQITILTRKFWHILLRCIEVSDRNYNIQIEIDIVSNQSAVQAEIRLLF